MSFSVIVLHRDKAAYSRVCLESLLGTAARPLQIINVDNGSRDETPQIVQEFSARAERLGIECHTLRFERNLGAVRGRNEALQRARGEFIAFLDNDTLCGDARWLDELAAALALAPHRAIVAPKLLFPWAPFAIECCGCGVSRAGKIEYLGRGAARDAIQTPRPLQAAISAAWLMKRELIARIGALDEAFSPVQYEDLDFCYRARAAGFSIWSAPAVELFHFEHTTTAGSDDLNFAYLTAKNGLLFKKRWGATFALENGPDEAQAAWKTLPKRPLEAVDWHALLPRRGE